MAAIAISNHIVIDRYKRLGNKVAYVIDDALEKLENGERIGDIAALGSASETVRIALEQLVDLSGIRGRNRVAADAELDQRQTQAPNVRLHRVALTF